jgi:hypothetical protein
MGQLRRPALIAASVAVFVLAACSGEMEESRAKVHAAAAEVSVRNLAALGSFSVTNHGPQVALLRRVVVEFHDDGGDWERVDADVRLIADCAETAEGEERVFPPGETLTVAPWAGWSCDGQCPKPCRANAYLGPGEFRFVVLTADRGRRFEGAGFPLGEPPPPIR